MPLDLRNLQNFDDFQFGSARQFDFDPTNHQAGQDILAQIRQVDPNARFLNTGPQGDAGNSMWQLDYDRSKLPPPPTLNPDNPYKQMGLGGPKDISYLNRNMNYSMINGGENGGGPAYHSYEQQGRSDKEGLYNPGLIKEDATYGRYTPQANLRPDPRDWKDTAWRYAPAAIMALGTMGAGGLLGAGLSAAGGTAAGAGAAGAGSFMGMGAGQLASGFNGLLGMGQGLANGQGMNWGSLAGLGAGALGLPPWATTLARMGTSYATGGRG
jgi:Tfp pilus assembly protein PilP